MSTSSQGPSQEQRPAQYPKQPRRAGRWLLIWCLLIVLVAAVAALAAGVMVLSITRNALNAGREISSAFDFPGP